MQWTEKYQPQKGCELLGNTNSVRKLNAWMMEWMHRLDAEMRKIRKQQMKQLGQRGRSAEESQKGDLCINELSYLSFKHIFCLKLCNFILVCLHL